jgi:hypothetical protein
MLANVLAAQAERESQDVSEGASASDAPGVERFGLPDVTAREGFELVEGYGAARRRRRRVVGIAVAASIVVALAGVGLSLRTTNGTSDAASEASYEAEAPKGEEATNGAEKIVMQSDAAAGSATLDEEEATQELDAMGGSIVDDEAYSSDLEAMGGSFDVSADPSYELASRYQLIRLEGQFDLHIVEHDGGPGFIDREWEEGLVGEAIAYDESDESDFVPCWVYRLPVSDDGLYVIRYIEDGSFYAARVIREETE